MIKKLMYLTIFALILTSCSATKSNYDDKILVSSREIFSADNPASPVHMDALSSEFIDIKYTGENTYKLDVEIWEDGVLVNTMTEAMGIELSQYNGISIEVDESNPVLYKVILGMYQEGGYTSMDFDIEVEPNALNGRIESAYSRDVEFAETEDIVLWGFHRFYNEFEVFGNTYEAAKKLEWSLVVVLRASSSSIDESTLPFDIDFDRVKALTVNTFDQANTFEIDEKWTEFIKVVTNFSYKSASISEVDEIWALSESEEDYYGVTLSCEAAVYSFLIFDNTIIANYNNMSSDAHEGTQFFVAKDVDIKALQTELSEIKLSSGTMLIENP